MGELRDDTLQELLVPPAADVRQLEQEKTVWTDAWTSQKDPSRTSGDVFEVMLKFPLRSG